MRSFTYNPLALQQQQQQFSTSLRNQPCLHLNKLKSLSIGRFRHSFVPPVVSSSRPVVLRSHKGSSRSRIELERNAAAGSGSNATVSSLATQRGRSGHGVWQCRAGREPASSDEKLVEIVKQELEIDVAGDRWQWTKTNQELVPSRPQLGFLTTTPPNAHCIAFDSNSVSETFLSTDFS